jgi:hypothetical protein
VVVLVSCLPVVTLGFGAALTHLLRAEAGNNVTAEQAQIRVNDIAGSAVPGLYLNGSGLHPAEAQPFAAELARGEVPSIRRIRAELHVGQPRAQEVQARLSALTRT